MKLTNTVKERLYHTQLRRWTDEELHKMRNSNKTSSNLLYKIVKEQEKRGLLVDTIENCGGSYPKEKSKIKIEKEIMDDVCDAAQWPY